MERLARMPPRLSGDQKLLTLLLGRTRAGIATVQPHTWLLYTPASAARRFDMFRTSLLFHRVLLSPEYLVRCLPLPSPVRHVSAMCSTVHFDSVATSALAHACMQDIIGLPEAPPSRRGRLSPPDELDAILKQSAGDFRTLLAFEKSAGAQHGGDAEASPYFRSLRRGSGHIMWNLTYGTFGATKLQNPPLTARSEARTPEQTAALRAGTPPHPTPPSPGSLRELHAGHRQLCVEVYACVCALLGTSVQLVMSVHMHDAAAAACLVHIIRHACEDCVS